MGNIRDSFVLARLNRSFASKRASAMGTASMRSLSKRFVGRAPANFRTRQIAKATAKAMAQTKPKASKTDPNADIIILTSPNRPNPGKTWHIGREQFAVHFSYWMRRKTCHKYTVAVNAGLTLIRDGVLGARQFDTL
ncbi:MAG: hypothetical protein HQ502_00100 [Alphaproteobacteria bacterium]|nr:hypothetical protein [Alphaproteobacteria bacterium]